MPTATARRKINAYGIAAAVIYFLAVLPMPTHAFAILPMSTAESPGRCNEKRSGLRPRNSFAVTNTAPNRVSERLLAKKNEDGGEKRQTDDEGLFAEKNIPGLVFTTVLTLWHFWIGPALRPILLDMQQ